MTTRGFSGRRPSADAARRLPSGQYPTDNFPVLSLGATPQVDLAAWKFTIRDGPKPIVSWTWAEFEALPRTVWRGDIHCVTGQVSAIPEQPMISNSRTLGYRSGFFQ